MDLVQIDYDEVEKDCQNVRPTRFNTTSLRGSLFIREMAIVIKLPSKQAKFLVAAFGSSIITGVSNRAYQEDTEDEILPHFLALHFHRRGCSCVWTDARSRMAVKLHQDDCFTHQTISFFD
ncbi:hypothetical protein FCULG_00009821 [Fusarium culmorum]|uniref:Uncharacterized protein n=1 Tax=Fusarium culmorum TaxID=5516 RepID=A0A2T4GGZ9_FUSCU|nr:hypothetical protein FCULG_00009821 [Fusarium culmorum]